MQSFWSQRRGQKLYTLIPYGAVSLFIRQRSYVVLHPSYPRHTHWSLLTSNRNEKPRHVRLHTPRLPKRKAVSDPYLSLTAGLLFDQKVRFATSGRWAQRSGRQSRRRKRASAPPRGCPGCPRIHTPPASPPPGRAPRATPARRLRRQ